MTKYQKLVGVKQQKFIPSQFWKLEAGSRGVQQSLALLACGCIAPVFIFVFMWLLRASSAPSSLIVPFVKTPDMGFRLPS